MQINLGQNTMSKLKEDTKGLQEELARYCRTNVEPELEGAKQDRLHHYRRLVFNVVQDSLETAYPLTFKLLAPKKWKKLVHEFFEKHDCQEYQVWRMPKEFYDYVLKQQSVNLDKHPFLFDLLKLEWKELEYYCLEDRPFPEAREGELAINPEYELLHFNWSVHRVNALHITADKQGDYYVLIFREPVDKKVKFVDLAPIHVAFVEQLEAHQSKLEPSLEALCSLSGIESKDYLKNKLEPFIADMKAKGFFA